MITMTTLLTVALVIALLAHEAVSSTRSAETHAFNVHDLWDMERLGDPQISPDGTWIVFDRKTYDLDKNKGTSNLWLVRPDGTDIKQLTSHSSGSTHPRWSHDGKSVYFLSARSGSMQVWKIAPDGGEAQQVTDEPLDVGGFVLPPTGDHIAYTMDVFPGMSPKETVEKLEEQKESKATGRVYDKLFIRHWDTWKDGTRSHLFVRQLDESDATDVTKDYDADVPSKPFGGSEEIAFTPDGKSLVFSMRDAGTTEAWSTHFDLYVANVDGSSKPKIVTIDNTAWITNPVFSPDGKQLAYLAMSRAGYESDRFRIVVMDWPNGKARAITESWDRSAGAIEWSPDNRTIYTAADNVGQRSMFAVDVASGEVRTVIKDGKVTCVVASADKLVFGHCHHQSPVELHQCKPDGSEVSLITQINSERVKAIRMGEPEQFSFAGWNDEEVYAYVVKPVDFDPSKRYPVAFLIHGGPQGSFGSDFHYRWNPQTYAGAGYAAIMVDFHGSTGYGQAFTDSICDDWGGKPFEDLQKGLEAALKRYSWMDGDRVAALGASYGGYMINWIAGNWPDRFRCLVNHDGNLDERMAYYDTEELWFPEWERHGTPWEKPEAYTKHNPIEHVAKWKTPMLVIHGGKDFRVVDTQGISTFTALQRKGIPSKMLYMPDENHWVLNPANSVLWHETVLGWLDQWTKA